MKLSKILTLSLLLVGISLTVVFGVAAHGNKETVDPELLNAADMPQDEQARALMSLATAFAPNTDKDRWIEFACAGMTKGGCDFFKVNQASAIWDGFAGQDGVSSGGSLVETITINDTAQFWKAHMIISSESKEIKSDVLFLVERGADGNWYLNRILYGPGIQPAWEG